MARRYVQRIFPTSTMNTDPAGAVYSVVADMVRAAKGARLPTLFEVTVTADVQPAKTAVAATWDDAGEVVTE